MTTDLSGKSEPPYYLLGALLGKYKEAEVALPGGCNIGSRPIDQHIKGFRALGAKVDINNSMIVARAEELRARHIYLDVVSVGATINIMLAASMAEGRTILENSAKEPHIVDVANFLNSMGADIKGAGTDVIRIRGVQKLHGTEYTIIPDQIEAGTFMCAAVATQRRYYSQTHVIPKHLESISAKLLGDGGGDRRNWMMLSGWLLPNGCSRRILKTLPYPGFPTDMQPQMAIALALADGTSVIITESIF